METAEGAKKIRENLKAPSLPRNIKAWSQKHLIPTYLIYDYKKGQKSALCRCTTCGRKSELSGIRHNKPAVCPHCHRNATAKSSGRFSRLYDRTTLQVIHEKSSNKLLVRWLKVSCLIRPHQPPVISLWESARAIVIRRPDHTVILDYYNAAYGSRRASWKPGIRPTFYGIPTYLSCLEGYLYTPSLQRELDGTDWKYSQLPSFYQANPCPMYCPDYLWQYQKYPFLEYFIKFVLYRLAKELAFVYRHYLPHSVINVDGKSAAQILRVRRQDLPLLRQLDPDFSQLQLIQKMVHEFGYIHLPLIEWYSLHSIGRTDNVIEPIRHMTPEALMKYAEAQCTLYHTRSTYCSNRYSVMSSVMDDYRDYLSMSAALELDMTNSFILYPKDLKTAHDQRMDLFSPGQLEIYNQAIASLHHELSPVYSFSRSSYLIRLPKSAEEICQEGAALHHCVQRYIPDYVKRKCILLFLREADAQEKPLCTLEVQGHRLMQAKCFDDTLPGPSIQKFLKAYENRSPSRSRRPSGSVIMSAIYSTHGGMYEPEYTC